MSADGTRVVIASPGRDAAPGGYASRGSAYVYLLVGSAWQLEQELVPRDLEENDHFGDSVTMSADGDRILVGAAFARSSTGAAYVFARSGTRWAEEQKLTGGSPSARFGGAVQLSADGRSAIVGAIFDGGDRRNPIGPGAAYVFAREGTVWRLAERLHDTGGESQDCFGTAVAINADAAVDARVEATCALSAAPQSRVIAMSYCPQFMAYTPVTTRWYSPGANVCSSKGRASVGLSSLHATAVGFVQGPESTVM